MYFAAFTDFKFCGCGANHVGLVPPPAPPSIPPLQAGTKVVCRTNDAIRLVFQG